MNEETKGLPVVAEPFIECWSCHVPVTLNERAECDGECPHCASELDLDDYLGTAVMALAELRQSIEGTNGYKYKAELYDEVWQAARDRGFGNVVGALAALDALQAELAAMREQKPCATIRLKYLGNGRFEKSVDRFDSKQLSDGLTDLYAAPVSAPSQVAAEAVRPAVSPSFPNDSRYTYCTTQATECASCGVRKHTPLRVDWMGGYVCLTCIDNQLDELNSAEDAEVVQVPRELLKRHCEEAGTGYHDCMDETGYACDWCELRALLATSQEKA